MTYEMNIEENLSNDISDIIKKLFNDGLSKSEILEFFRSKIEEIENESFSPTEENVSNEKNLKFSVISRNADSSPKQSNDKLNTFGYSKHLFEDEFLAQDLPRPQFSSFSGTSYEPPKPFFYPQFPPQFPNLPASFKQFPNSPSSSNKGSFKQFPNSPTGSLVPSSPNSPTGSLKQFPNSPTGSLVPSSPNSPLSRSSSNKGSFKQFPNSPSSKNYDFLSSKPYNILLKNKEEESNNFFSESQIRNGTNVLLLKEDDIVTGRAKKNVAYQEEKIDYVEKTYEYLNEQEERYKVKDIMLNQMYIKENMYEILIDYLISVHLQLKAFEEVLYLCVHLINRYLNVVKDTHKSKFQLVGLTCYLIADKYESIYPSEIRDLVRFSDYAFYKDEFVKMEFEILKVLNFSLMSPTSYTFLVRYLTVADSDEEIDLTALYVSQRILQVSDLTNYLPSIIASACVYISLEINNKDPWSDKLTYYSRYDVNDIQECVNMIKNVVTTKSNRNAVYRKFSRDINNGVAKKFELHD